MTRELRRVLEDYPASPVATASLGLVSIFARLDRLLDEHAPERPPSSARRLSDERGSARANGRDFVLGLLAVRRRVFALLDEHAPARPAPATPPAPEPPAESLWR